MGQVMFNHLQVPYTAPGSPSAISNSKNISVRINIVLSLYFLWIGYEILEVKNKEHNGSHSQNLNHFPLSRFLIFYSCILS